MSITTRRGDDGSTDLMFGKRIAKTEARVEAIGSLDELNSVLGLARIDIVADLGDSIDRLQGHLVGLMGELAVLPEDAACYGESGHPSIGEDEVAMVESLARDLEDGGISFEGWARPGAKGNRTGAQLDFARTVCRRAERRTVSLHVAEPVDGAVLRYLNRLSDLLFTLARLENARAGRADVPWVGRERG